MINKGTERNTKGEGKEEGMQREGRKMKENEEK